MANLILHNHLSGRSTRFSSLGFCTVRSVLIRAEAPDEPNLASEKPKNLGSLIQSPNRRS